MKTVIISISIALIVLGMWAISSSFTEPSPTKGDQGRIETAQGQQGSPIGIGVATMVGGVLLLVLASRRGST